MSAEWASVERTPSVDTDQVFHATDDASRRWLEGMCRDQLLVRVSRDHYLRADVANQPEARRALLAELLPKGTVAGLRTAVWAFGGPPLDPDAPVRVLAAPHARPYAPGLRITRFRFGPDQITHLDGVALTTPLRTATDLVCHGEAGDDEALWWLLDESGVSTAQLWKRVRGSARGQARRHGSLVLMHLQEGEVHPITLARRAR